MSFFRRKNDSVIPPVSSEPKSDPYANPSRPQPQGDPYARKNAPGGGGGGDPYARANALPSGDPYARSRAPAGGAAPDAARNELFAGFTPAAKPSQDRKYGYEGREMEEDYDEDEEVEGIKQEMRGIKQDSLASTRNALRLAREAEDSARGTVAKLADQSERIANSERYLDMAKANNARAEDKTAELKQLRKSIFKPVVVWNKDSKRQAEEEKIAERHLTERADRAKAISDVSDTRKRLGGAANPNPMLTGTSRMPLPGEAKAKKDARSRYQFEATASDDELEDELDENLDETLEVTRRLKTLAVAMGDEVSGQNSRLTRVTDKTENLEFGLMKNTERLARIK